MKQTKKSKTGGKKESGIQDEIRGIGVLIEHVDEKVGLVAEQYGDIKKTLNSHTKILEAHTEMIGNITVDLAIIKEDVALIKNSIKKKVDIDEFAALERRVLILEKHR